MSTLLCAETLFSIFQKDERAEPICSGRWPVGGSWARPPLIGGGGRGLPFDLRPRIGREFRLLAAGLGLCRHGSGL